MTLLERFLNKIEPEPMSGCWLWIGTTDGRYGKVKVLGGGVIKAHRVAWEFVHGPVSSGLQVLHRCDVTRCVNPSHLFLGTQRDNVLDGVLKGRHSQQRLSADAIAEIQRSVGQSQRALARRFHVAQKTIWSIVNGKRWLANRLAQARGSGEGTG